MNCARIWRLVDGKVEYIEWKGKPNIAWADCATMKSRNHMGGTLLLLNVLAGAM